MKLVFILGRKHSLALAEIFSVFSRAKISHELISVSNEWLLTDIKSIESIKDIEVLQKTLGGTVKILELVDELKNAEAFASYPISKFQEIFIGNKPQSERVQFGFSTYGDRSSFSLDFVRELGMTLKRHFEDYGHKVRFIFNSYNTIESVTFEKKIKGKGVDLNILTTKDGKIYLAKTLTVQPFEEYSKRDYGRPMVSRKSGALPPKLAQVMVNLASVPKDKRLYDPFCGSGTVLQEAMVQGYNVVGSDMSRKAIQQTEQNLGWLKKNVIHNNDIKFQVFQTPVSDILKNKDFVRKYIETNKIGGMAMEPFLGPTLQNVINHKDKNYKYMLGQVSGVYEDLFKVAGEIMHPGQLMILVVPAYKTNEGWELLDIEELYEKDFTKRDLLDTLPESDFGNIERDLTWDRPQSIIRRYIFPLERKK